MEPEEALRKIEGMFNDYWGALFSCLDSSSVKLSVKASELMNTDKEVFELYMNILKEALNVKE